jgi:imidazolonepropionase-like amidohydrolase
VAPPQMYLHYRKDHLKPMGSAREDCDEARLSYSRRKDHGSPECAIQRIPYMRLALILSLGLLAITADAVAQTARKSAHDEAPPASPALPGPGAISDVMSNPYASTYVVPSARPFVIINANILTAAGPMLHGAAISVRAGKIVEVGAHVEMPAEAEIIDAKGRYVTPGIIDIHSHVGIMAAPQVPAHMELNEIYKLNFAENWAELAIWPQDPQIMADLTHGVTTVQVLPGSATLIGGRTVILHTVPATTTQEMKFPGAGQGLKIACGENPLTYSQQHEASTVMGEMSVLRKAFIDAEQYSRTWSQWKLTHEGPMPKRDLAMETLGGVLSGEIFVNIHCYRATDMVNLIDLSHEFGFKIRSFHHTVEGYKIGSLLAKEGIGAAVWADLGDQKTEAIDSIKANAALLYAEGARVITHSDDPSYAQRLTQDTAKMMEAGDEIGIHVSEDEAIKWNTINPAWAMGLDKKIGSLEKGKNADIVLWSGNPFSVYTRADEVWIDGALRFDRSKPETRPTTDFELGYVPGVTK